jgi:HipA-like C-terminal domain
VDALEKADALNRGVVTMGPVDADFIGTSTQSWSNVAVELVRQRRLPADDAVTVTKLDAFGRLIFNSDRHLGNCSLFWDDERDHFRLAPIYDMLPMFFRPNTQGQHPKPTAPIADARTLGVWKEMQALARIYWQRVLDDGRVSESFKRDCAEPAARLSASSRV